MAVSNLHLLSLHAFACLTSSITAEGLGPLYNQPLNFLPHRPRGMYQVHRLTFNLLPSFRLLQPIPAAGLWFASLSSPPDLYTNHLPLSAACFISSSRSFSQYKNMLQLFSCVRANQHSDEFCVCVCVCVFKFPFIFFLRFSMLLIFTFPTQTHFQACALDLLII